MRNVVIPNLPFLPSPPLPSLSLIGCHELLDVCLVCACVRACVWQLSTSDQRGLRLCWMSGRIIKRRRLSYSAWRRWLHLWPTHTHTRRLCHFFFSLPVFFFFSFCFHQSVNLSALSPTRLSHFDAPHIMPTLEHTQQGLVWGVRQKWVEECGKCHPSDNDRKKCPYVCVCALAKLCLCPLQV